jgi:acyl-coenzyme A thioesterase PaaI-like protein
VTAGPPVEAGPGAREELAAAVRRLAVLSITTLGGDGDLRVLTADLERVANALARLPTRAEGPRFDPAAGGDGPAALHQVMPFDMVVGRCNPTAPPVTITFQPPRALGVARFAATHEGAPGWVHGAAVAAAFDMVLTAANLVRGVAGPTVSLSLRYRRPTLLGEDCRFEAWVESVKGSRVRTRGRLVQDAGTTVEAEGEFVSLRYEDIQARTPGTRAPGGPAR